MEHKKFYFHFRLFWRGPEKTCFFLFSILQKQGGKLGGGGGVSVNSSDWFSLTDPTSFSFFVVARKAKITLQVPTSFVQENF